MMGDFSSVSINGYLTNKKALEAWENIFNEFIGKYGLPDSYIEYIEKRKRAADYFDQAYNSQKWLIIKANIMQAEAEQMELIKGESIEVSCARISKFLGFAVNPNKCTVSEFYGYVELMKQM